MRRVIASCALRAEAICTVLLLPAACADTSSSQVDFSLTRKVRWRMRVRRLL